jgi:ornithine cyclodeaminase/alanine dehydrogenase-like protein (mu-crystallin family)
LRIEDLAPDPHVGEIHHGITPRPCGPRKFTIFDSTGTALQDLTAAMLVYNKVRVAAGTPGFAS